MSSEKRFRRRLLPNDYEEKLYLRKFSAEEGKRGSARIWYLPQFTVENPFKPKKLKLVFVAVAKSEIMSINDGKNVSFRSTGIYIQLDALPDELLTALGKLVHEQGENFQKSSSQMLKLPYTFSFTNRNSHALREQRERFFCSGQHSNCWN